MINKEKLIPTLIICVTVILSFLITLKTGIYIKSIGGVESNGKISNTISVTGDGKVSAKPDMVILSFSFEETQPTSKAALDTVNQKITQAQKILKDNGIADSDITTTNLSISPEYNYTEKIRRLTSQRASQTLEVKVKKIDDKASKVVQVIDQLSAIDNVQINSVQFDIEDKTKLFSEARELAFQKAEQKAKELAKLSKVSLGKPVSISDSTYDIASPTSNTFYKADMVSLSSAGGGTSVATGEMNISINLSILWGIE